MQKLKTFWTSFQKSLLDFTYYKDVAKASFWFSYKYLFLLLICLSLFRTVQLGILYSSARGNIPSYLSTFQKELTAIYPKELELRVSNGNLYTNVKEPYIIEFPKVFGDVEEKHLIVIDTKGTADNYPKYNSIVLVTKQAVVFPGRDRGSSSSTQMYYFSDLKRSVYVDHSLYSEMIKKLSPFLAKLPRLIDITVVVFLVLLPFIGGFFWTASTLFGLIFLTIIIWIIEKIIKTSYGYGTLFRMGIHGSTWAILFSFLLDITNQKVDFLYNIIFIAWMVAVVLKNREQKSVT